MIHLHIDIWQQRAGRNRGSSLRSILRIGLILVMLARLVVRRVHIGRRRGVGGIIGGGVRGRGRRWVVPRVLPWDGHRAREEIPLAAPATKAWTNLESVLCHGRESVWRQCCRSRSVASLLLLLLRLLRTGVARCVAVVAMLFLLCLVSGYSCRLSWREKKLGCIYRFID